MHSIILQHSALKRLESLAWKRAAIKTQMICLTSFFCSCEYASDIFPHVFSPTGGFVPKTVERGTKKQEEENMEEVQRKRDQERQHVRPVWMSSEAKVGDHGHGDRLCPVDKAHQQRHWENDTSSSLKSLIFPSQGAWRLHKTKLCCHHSHKRHCYSRFVKKYLLSWWCQYSN